MTNAARSERLLVEAMEERILHSADLGPLASGLVASVSANTDADAVARVSEIAFIDASLPQAKQLRDDLWAQRSAGRPIDVVMIGADEDGIEVISRALAARDGVTAVHLLAHGADGRVQLGTAVLDGDALLRRAGEVAGWGAALHAEADLLVYGCEVAQGEAGRQLVRDLSALTGADIAASADLTGAAARGGDWALEMQVGTIDAALAPSRTMQAGWAGVMATYTVTTTLDSVGTPLPGTLRWAISQANANVGADTIMFAVDGRFAIAPLSSGDDDNDGGDLDITDSVTIVGNGTGTTVIAGNGVDRVFDVRAGTVSFSGLTIEGGRSNTGAGVRINGGSTAVTMQDVVVQDNLGSGATKGGGLFLNDGSLTLRRVIVQNNGDALSGDTDGAGLYVDSNGRIDVQDVEFRGNVAAKDKDGGGVYLSGGVTATFDRVTFADNQAKRGGGLWTHGDRGVTLTNVTFNGNVALAEGGALWADRAVTLDHVTVAGNSATAGNGGGVYDNGGGNVTSSNSIYAGNTGGNAKHALLSAGYNLSDDASTAFTGTGDLSAVSTASIGLQALASNGGFTRTMAIGPGSLARDAANPADARALDQRGLPRFGRADIGAYEYNPYGFAPTVGTIGDQTIAEDQSLGPIGFTVGDVETAAGALVVTATSSNTALVANAGVVLGGSGANRTLSLTPVAHANGSNAGGTATITVTVSDGSNTTTTSFVLTVLPVNDAPTIALPGSATTVEDTALVLAGAQAPRIADVDAGTAPVQLTLTATHGTLTLSSVAGLSFVSGDGSGDATMTFNGTLAAINAALDGLRLQPEADYSGAAQIDFSLSDLGSTGSGGAQTASASLAVTVTAINDAPTLQLPGPQSTPQPTPLEFSDANGNAIVIADVDVAGGPLQLNVSTAGGTLAFGNLGGATVVGGDGSTSFVLQGTLAQLNAALQTLSFSGAAPGATQIDLSIDDGGGSGSGGALQAAGSVTVTVGNNALPSLAPSHAGVATQEDQPPVLLDAGFVVTDADHATLASATLRFTAGYAGAQDVLALSATSGIGNITASYANGVLTLSSAGASASLAEWQEALRSVTYQNTSQSPSTATRTIAVTVNDGIADSALRTLTVDVAALNDAPVLSGGNDLAPVNEDEANGIGTLVSTLLAGFVGDADGGAAGIVVTAVDDSQGTWQYSLDGGSTWTAFGSVSTAQARLLAANALTAVRFVPGADWNGSVAGGLEFHAWDQTSGVAGATADASVTGDSTAFSSGVAQVSVAVHAVNDAPQRDVAIPDRSATQDTPFSYVVPGNSFSDLDAGDTLTYSATLASGAPLPAWLSFDATTRTFSGTPGNDDVGTLTIRVSATDVSGASASDTFVLVVDDVNDAPTLNAAIGVQGVSEGLGFALPLPPGTFSDADAGDTLTYSATLADGGPLPSWLSFDAATQTFSGLAGDADVGSLTIRVTATDASGVAVSVDFSLVVSDVDEAPVLAAPIPAQSATQGTPFSFTLPAGTFTDPDPGDTLTYTARLASGAALPAWLSFDAATQNFSGTPGSADVSTLSIRVTATDSSGMSRSGTFTLTVGNVNDAPVLTGPIAAQSALEDSPFTFVVPANSFRDPDAGDTLTYHATLTSGAPLPAWLTFDGARRTFSGTPGDADPGTLSLRIIATDGSGASASGDFTLTVVNADDAPTVVTAVPAQAATEDAPFVFTLPTGAFEDADAGDTLVLSAELASGARLPAWLSFDATTRTFSGTPGNADVGTLTIAVRATDASGLGATTAFALDVANINDAPRAVATPADRTAQQDAPFEFVVPPGTFTDADAGDVLRVAATLADGSALPAWLRYDAQTGTFHGTPGAGDPGSLALRLVAYDAAGATAEVGFALLVRAAPPEAPPVDEPVSPPLEPRPVTPSSAPDAAAPAATPSPPAAAAPAAAEPEPTPAPRASLAPLIDDARADAAARDTPPTPTTANAEGLKGRSPSSRADDVLEQPVLVQYSGLAITSTPLGALWQHEDVLRRFDELQRDLQRDLDGHRVAVASGLALSGGLSVGYVVWLLRGGVLVGSMLSAMPAWQMIDPMPVLAASRRSGDRKPGVGEDGDVDRLFDRSQPPPAPPAPASAVRPSCARLDTLRKPQS